MKKRPLSQERIRALRFIDGCHVLVETMADPFWALVVGLVGLGLVELVTPPRRSCRARYAKLTEAGRVALANAPLKVGEAFALDGEEHRVIEMLSRGAYARMDRACGIEVVRATRYVQTYRKPVLTAAVTFATMGRAGT